MSGSARYKDKPNIEQIVGREALDIILRRPPGTTRRRGNMADIQALVEQISNLTVLQAAELKKALQEKLGITALAAMPVAAAGASAGGGAAAGAVRG